MNRYHATIKKSARSIRALTTMVFEAFSLEEAHQKIDWYIDNEGYKNDNRQPYVRIIQL